MSNKIRTIIGQEAPVHECEATKHNDLITYTCPTCGYVRQFTYSGSTCETRVIREGDPTVMHRGQLNDFSMTFGNRN